MIDKKIKIKRLGLVSGLVACMLLVAGTTSIEQTEEGIAYLGMNIAVAEYAQAAGDSGWLEIYLMPHSGTPGVTYDENTSATLEAAALAYFDTDGWSTSSFPSETSFDIVIRCRFNKTHCWRTDQFIDTRVRVNLTVAGHSGAGDWAVGSDFSDSAMTKIVTYNNSGASFLWANFYLDNAGSGYQLSDGGQLDFSAPKLEAEF